MIGRSYPLPDLLQRLPGHDTKFVSLERAEAIGLCATSALPMVLKILLEGVLRHADDGANDHALPDFAGLAAPPRRGLIEFRPSRLLLQDFTGLPLMTDLASLRDAVAERGIDPAPHQPDHSGRFLLSTML